MSSESGSIQDILKTKEYFADAYAKLEMQDKANLLYKDVSERSIKLLEWTWINAPLSDEGNVGLLNQFDHNVKKYLSHTTQYFSKDDNAVNQAFTIWMNYKGSALEYASATPSTLNQLDNSKLTKKYIAIQKRLLELRNVDRLKVISDTEKVMEFSKEFMKIKQSQAEIKSEILPTLQFRVNKRLSTSVNLLKSALNGAAYVDFALIPHFDFISGTVSEGGYYAFVVSPNTQTHLVDLGKQVRVNTLIRQYQKNVRKLTTGNPAIENLNTISSSLYDEIWSPLTNVVAASDLVYLNLDSALHVFPFEALRDHSGKYLLETSRLVYISSASEFVTPASEISDSNKNKALILANPDYEKSSDEAALKADFMLADSTLRSLLGEMEFVPLADTMTEAELIQQYLSSTTQAKVELYSGKNASKERLFESDNHSIVHIATHGFFLNNARVWDGDTRSFDALSSTKDESSPMLRSGLALAGSNQDRGNGIVLAAEIPLMRLSGTDLVVLSACDTGVGDLEASEGVMGLKRGFAIAGARNLVTSLWPVSSSETVGLMKSFYEKISNGVSKPEALRQAKLEMLTEHPNPFFWAPFVMTSKYMH